jgi:hypothetical protein
LTDALKVVGAAPLVLLSESHAQSLPGATLNAKPEGTLVTEMLCWDGAGPPSPYEPNGKVAGVADNVGVTAIRFAVTVDVAPAALNVIVQE